MQEGGEDGTFGGIQVEKGEGDRQGMTAPLDVQLDICHLTNVCPNPDPPADQSCRDGTLSRCAKTGQMLADIQEMVARRPEPNATSTAPLHTFPATQPRIPNRQTRITKNLLMNKD